MSTETKQQKIDRLIRYMESQPNKGLTKTDHTFLRNIIKK